VVSDRPVVPLSRICTHSAGRGRWDDGTTPRGMRAEAAESEVLVQRIAEGAKSNKIRPPRRVDAKYCPDKKDLLGSSIVQGHLGIAGFNESDGEPFMMSLGGILDRQVFAGPVDKDRIEDLQIWAAMQALGFHNALKHPLSIRPGGDPPDRLISCGDRTWGVELTELTIQDVRQDLAPVRTFGRMLQQRLRDQPERFAHLRGRVVMLTKLADQALPRNLDSMLKDVEQALSEDRGDFGEDMDWTAGAPEHLGERGRYDNQEAFSIVVNKSNDGAVVHVSATSHFQLYRSKALSALGARIKAKDKPGNEIIIVTCGLPDRQGYACPSDHDLFIVLEQAAKDKIPGMTERLSHVLGILIHLWGSNQIYSLTDDQDVPWTTTTPRA
jgi:hypothetical protein